MKWMILFLLFPACTFSQSQDVSAQQPQDQRQQIDLPNKVPYKNGDNYYELLLMKFGYIGKDFLTDTPC